MPDESGSETYHAGDGVAWVLDGEHVVLMLIGSGEPVALDAIGSVVWLGLVDDGLGLHDVVATLSETFPSETDRIKGDVTSLVAALLAEGYLQPATAL